MCTANHAPYRIGAASKRQVLVTQLLLELLHCKMKGLPQCMQSDGLCKSMFSQCCRAANRLKFQNSWLEVKGTSQGLTGDMSSFGLSCITIDLVLVRMQYEDTPSIVSCDFTWNPEYYQARCVTRDMEAGVGVEILKTISWSIDQHTPGPKNCTVNTLRQQNPELSGPPGARHCKRCHQLKLAPLRSSRLFGSPFPLRSSEVASMKEAWGHQDGVD